MPIIPNYRSKQHLSVQSRIVPLDAPLIKVNSPSVKPNGSLFKPSYLNPTARTAQIDRVGSIIKGDDITRLSSVLLQRSLQLADEENTRIAREQVSKVKQSLFDINYGENGYALREGKDAVISREETVKRINQITTDAYDTSPEAVKKKMFLTLQNEKDRALSFVYKHASNQTKVWDKNQEAIALDDAARDLSVTGSQPQELDKFLTQKVLELYPIGDPNDISPQQELKRRKVYDQLASQHIDSLISSPGGLQAAMQAHNSVHVKLSPEANALITDKIGKGAKAYVAEQRARQTEADQYRTKLRAQTQNNLLAEVIKPDGKKLSKDQLSTLLSQQKISSTFAQGYISKYIDKDTTKSDPYTEFQYREQLRSDVDSGDTNLLENPTIISAISDPDVDRSGADRLIKFAEQLRTTKEKSRVKWGLNQIEIMTAPQGIVEKKLYQKEVERRKAFAEDEYLERIKNEDPRQVITDMDKRYSQDARSDVYIPTLRSGVRPTNWIEWNRELDRLDTEFANGNISKDKFEFEKRVLDAYGDYLNREQKMGVKKDAQP